MHLIRLIASILVLLLAAPCLAEEQPARGSIQGFVTDSDGKPVQGATVYVWTAAVKTGYNTLCPSCYADCGKLATTNTKGHFELEALDPELLFQLMVAKEGFTPTPYMSADPRGAEPVIITIDRRPPLPDDKRQTISGLVLDLDGNPVANAKVTPKGVTWQPPGSPLITAMGSIPGLDLFTLTNAKGEFTLAFSQGPVQSWNLRVDAIAFAGAHFRNQTTSQAMQGLKIGSGAIVRGRLLQDGKPVANKQVLLSHADKTSLRFLGEERIATDNEGYFAFANVPIAATPPPNPQQRFLPPEPPANGWWLSPAFDASQNTGAAPPRMILVSKHGEDVYVGDIALAAPIHLKGRVILADGKAVPLGSRIYASLESSSDTIQADLGHDGSFVLNGLHPNAWIICVAVPGYGVSPSNPNYFGDCLRGRLDTNMDGFVLAVESNREPTPLTSEPPLKPFTSINLPLPATPGGLK